LIQLKGGIQEDEEILFERKMKAEEEEVDIDTLAASSDPNASALVNGNVMDVIGGSTNGTPASTVAVVGIMGDKDPDILWADEEPDGDDPGEWRMRIVMDNEAADYY
jgi:COMPASS component SWD1